MSAKHCQLRAPTLPPPVIIIAINHVLRLDATDEEVRGVQPESDDLHSRCGKNYRALANKAIITGYTCAIYEAHTPAHFKS